MRILKDLWWKIRRDDSAHAEREALEETPGISCINAESLSAWEESNDNIGLVHSFKIVKNEDGIGVRIIHKTKPQHTVNYEKSGDYQSWSVGIPQNCSVGTPLSIFGYTHNIYGFHSEEAAKEAITAKIENMQKQLEEREERQRKLREAQKERQRKLDEVPVITWEPRVIKEENK